jgi:3-oxosteroid 1-dehydrogenase
LVGHKWSSRGLGLKLALRGLRAKLLGRKMVPSGGQMLVARLRAALLEADVPLLLECGLDQIVTDSGGEVVGAHVNCNGRITRIRTRGGVVIATGGFERNNEMRQRYQAPPINSEWTLGSPGNTGDGILAGISVGADVAFMDDAWWAPGLLLPSGKSAFCLGERQVPGGIMVTETGERFTNEAAPYVNVVHAMYEGNHVPCYFVIDTRYRKRYKLGPLLPRQPIPEKWFTSGVAFKANSIEELAAVIGLPSDGLVESVRRFNGFAETGQDLDFHRGESVYDRYYADDTIGPNPSLGPIDEPPFYAFKMVAGDLGTKGGLKCDQFSRVLRPDGSPIPGLYAAGNASASVMGHEYPGPGSTIGPAVVFGYLAARHLATRVGMRVAVPTDSSM